MGKLVSTKIESKGEETALVSPAHGEDRYSWGTSITLEKDILDRLGLSPADIQVGQEVRVVASGKVTAVSQRTDEGSETSSVSVQLVEIGVEAGADPEDEFDTAWNEAQSKD